MTKQEDRDEKKRQEEITEKRFPVAMATCPACKSVVVFKAGQDANTCRCGAVLDRKAKTE